MIDIVNKRCKEANCVKFPIYGNPGEKIPKFCKHHSKEGMIDIKNKRCEEENCMKKPYYGYPGD